MATADCCTRVQEGPLLIMCELCGRLIPIEEAWCATQHPRKKLCSECAVQPNNSIKRS